VARGSYGPQIWPPPGPGLRSAVLRPRAEVFFEAFALAVVRFDFIRVAFFAISIHPLSTI